MATPATQLEAKRSLDELYRAHAAEIYRYAYAVLGNRADAEDVMQTTFVNALRALERGEVPRKPANWLITIAHNLIRQRFRQQHQRPRQVELDSEISAPETDDSGPSIDDLVRALQRIPETQREALVLRELEGRSYKEIASILGLSLSALQTLLFRARRSLTEELENLVTCDRAELALSQLSDGRLGRKERKRLLAHLEECSACARIAVVARKRRRAFKGLALLPLPWSLTFFKGAPSATAAVGLPTIGAGAAAGGTAGVVGGGVAAKVAIGFAAVAVAGGAGYEGVKAVDGPAPAARAAAPVAVAPDRVPRVTVKSEPAVVAAVKPAAKKPRPTKVAPAKVAPTKIVPARLVRERGRSAAAPGQTKRATKPKPTAAPKQKTSKQPQPKTTPGAAKSAAAKSRPEAASRPKQQKPEKREKEKPLAPLEQPVPPALPRGPNDDEVLPELVRDRAKGPRP